MSRNLEPERIESKQIDSKKNKQTMVSSNNNMISQRGQDEADINNNRYRSHSNVDRIMLERQMTKHNFENDDTYIGEVTGEEFDGTDVFDKGMPVRSSYTVKKTKYDNNEHLDFNLYQRIEKRKIDTIGYSDISSGEYAGIDDAMQSITKGTDPYETCVTDINTTTCWMNSNMYVFSKDDYIVNGFGLFSAFGVIYLISKANTELELKNYFNFQDKKHLNAGLLTIRDDLTKCRDQIIIDNYLLNDKNIPNNENSAKKLKSLIFNIVFNKDYPEQESCRINNIIYTLSGIKDVVSSGTISKSNISIISISKISPIWAFKIDNIIKGRFQDRHKQDAKVTNFIRFVGKTFNYYEDAEKQVIEVPMKGDIYVIGMILSKENRDTSTDLKSLSVSINYLKPTVLDEVLIPIINKRYKIRLNKTLQKTGLTSVFAEQNMDKLFSKGGTLNDCIQYVDLIFGSTSCNKICNNKGYRTTCKFIANRSFEFYVRNIQNNCIMIMGRL